MQPYQHCSTARAALQGDCSHRSLRGDVQFLQKRNGVLITACVTGLPQDGPGFFAFHIHEGCGCAGEAFQETGAHYNPAGSPHPLHAGDLPPLLSCGGEAFLSVLTDRFCLGDVIGRTVVIHSAPDDFSTQPAGNAGDKIACGVICAG